MQPKYRLSHAAGEDFKKILDWSEDNFGEAARDRYDALIVAAIRHAARNRNSARFKARPELGDDIVSWHLSNSVSRSRGEKVKEPRHLLVCRWEGDRLAAGRILHEVQDPTRHVTRDSAWG